MKSGLLSSCFVFVFSIILLFSCSYQEGLFPKQDKGGKFEISVPDFMSSTKRLSQASDFQYQNRFRTFYLVVIESALQDSEKRFDEFVQNEINVLHSSVDSIFSDTIIYSENSILPTTNYSAELYIGKELFYYRLAFIEHHQSVFTIVIWTLESKKEDYEEMIEEMVQSFRIL